MLFFQSTSKCFDNVRLHFEMQLEDVDKENFSGGWSSGNAFVYGTVGARPNSRTSQIGHSTANYMPALRYLFERSCFSLQTQ